MIIRNQCLIEGSSSRVYNGEMHPLTGLLYLMMGKIQFHLGKLKQALEALEKANMILTITHGDKHSVMKEELRPLLYQATMEAMSIDMR